MADPTSAIHKTGGRRPNDPRKVYDQTKRRWILPPDDELGQGKKDETMEEEDDDDIGPCGCLKAGCIRCGTVDEDDTVSNASPPSKRKRISVWSDASNDWVTPKLPPPCPVAPQEVLEHVDTRALTYLQRCTIDDFYRMCNAGMTQKDACVSFKRVQAYLQATKGSVSRRRYTVDKKQAPTRLYCHESVQPLPRIVRNMLLGDITWDFDMKNAAPVALRFICACLGEAAPNLDEYCDGREKKWQAVVQSLGVSEKRAKKLFIQAMYSRWQVRKVKVVGEWKTIHDPFFKAFDGEMKHLQQRLQLRPELEWALLFAREDPDPKRSNKAGSFVAFLTQWIEGHCLTAAIRVAERFELVMALLMHDGFNAVKSDDVDPNAVCRALHDECEVSLPGIGMQWMVKEPDCSVYDEDKRAIGECKVPERLPPPEEPRNENASSEDGLEEVSAKTVAFREMAQEFDKTHFRVDGDYIDEFWNAKREACDIDTVKKRYIDWIHYRWQETTKTGELIDREERFIDRWLYRHNEQDGKRVYRRFDQIPHTLPCPTEVYNTWKPWPCLTPVECTEERFVYVLSKALKHLKVMAGNDWSAFEVCCKFFAQAMQFPHIKSAVALIFYGAEGTGKSTWMKLLRKMFGEAFGSTTRPEEDIWGKFNAMAEGIFMLELSETDRSNMHDFWGRVNGFIAEVYQTIRRMNTNAYEVKNYARVVGTTNNPVATKPGRRYAVCESSTSSNFMSRGSVRLLATLERASTRAAVVAIDASSSLRTTAR